MSADVIKFPSKVVKKSPSPEEVQAQKLELIEEFIDNNVQLIIRDMVDNIPDLNWELLEEIDTPTQKVVALMRETMRAVIFKFQNKHHDLQDIAEEIIEFEEDAREIIIEGN